MFICENVVALHYQMLLPFHKRLIQLDYNLSFSESKPLSSVEIKMGGKLLFGGLQFT